VTRLAEVSNADSGGAKVASANYSFGKHSYVDFSSMDLQFADFNSANLFRAKFTKANLKQAKLVFCDCTDVDFRWANLEEADLRNTNFSKADFANANLTRAKMFSASFSNTNFTGAITTGLQIFEDEIAAVRNLDLSQVDIYDRKTNKLISAQNSSQRKDEDRTSGEPYAPPRLQAPTQVAKNSKATSFQTQESAILLKVRKEVDEFVEQIQRIRGSDTALAFASPSEIQRILNSIQEITDRALARAAHFYGVVHNDLLTFDKEELVNQIDKEFERVSRAIGYRG